MSELEEGTLEWAEDIYMNGSADEVSGDVEAPTGHFYRVGQYIVTTDSQGFKEMDDYWSEERAKFTFANVDEEYAEWCDEDA